MRTALFLMSVAPLLLSTAAADERPVHVVATSVDASDPYHEAARVLAEHRRSEIISFDPADLAPLAEALIAREARYVAVVVGPEVIDTNFIRRFLMMATRLDEDPFCDIAWGYVTGASADDAVRFVRNMIRAETEGLPKRYLYSFVSSRSTSAATGPAWLSEAGYEVAQLGLGTGDEKVEDFAAGHMAEFENRGLIKMTGCGDPERIWLFDDHRNAERDKHWAYDRDKVGQNPDGQMRWLEAEDFRKVDLYPAVLTSGTCHCGSLSKVFVEGDIVSTFGTSDRVEVYQMPAEKSLGLTWLARGATAAILPVGPNHGWRTEVEVRRMFATGAPLGDVMRSAYDELALAAGGPIELGLYDDSGADPDHGIEQIMRGGAANRVLYGDPLYQPFERIDEASIEVGAPRETSETTYTLEARVTRAASPDAVDQFTSFRSRLFFAAVLPESLAGRGLAAVRLESAEGPSPEAIHWALEEDRGRTLLHAMAFSSRSAFEGGLGSKAGQSIRLVLEVAPGAAERRRSGRWQGEAPPAPRGAVETSLDGLWGYRWENWAMEDVLEFIETFLGRRDRAVAGSIHFEIEPGAREAARKKVTLRLDSESLRIGLDRLCEATGLTYSVEPETNTVRIREKRPPGVPEAPTGDR